MVIESERDDSPLDFATAYRERVLGENVLEMTD